MIFSKVQKNDNEDHVHEMRVNNHTQHYYNDDGGFGDIASLGALWWSEEPKPDNLHVALNHTPWPIHHHFYPFLCFCYNGHQIWRLKQEPGISTVFSVSSMENDGASGKSAPSHYLDSQSIMMDPVKNVGCCCVGGN